jgi:hypothetical protein
MPSKPAAASRFNLISWLGRPFETGACRQFSQIGVPTMALKFDHAGAADRAPLVSVSGSNSWYTL